MAIYSHRQRTSNVTTAAACHETRTAATDRARLLEIGITLVTAAATVIGIGRPAAIGVTPTSPVTWLAEDPGEPAGTVQTAVAWATGPTVPAQHFRGVSFPGTIGAGTIFTFPRGLVIAVSAALVLWNILGGATLEAYACGDE